MTCKFCGCSDLAACDTPFGPCFWTLPEICSWCVTLALQSELLAEIFELEEPTPAYQGDTEMGALPTW